MLKVISRRAAPWACAWMLGLPMAHAIEDAPSEQGASAPFEHYRGWRDEPPQDWRAANDRVGAIGGWRSYLRESQLDVDGADSGGHGDHSYPGQ